MSVHSNGDDQAAPTERHLQPVAAPVVRGGEDDAAGLDCLEPDGEIHRNMVYKWIAKLIDRQKKI